MNGACGMSATALSRSRACAAGACGVTQALLPWFVVAWRWDLVEVIGAALDGRRGVWPSQDREVDWPVGDHGAGLVSPPFCWSGQWVRVGRPGSCRACTAALPGPPGEAMAAQWRSRRGPVRAWQLANLITSGRWLATNTTVPLAAGRAWPWMRESPSRRCQMAPDWSEELASLGAALLMGLD